jgi:hypothetical protein
VFIHSQLDSLSAGADFVLRGGGLTLAGLGDNLDAVNDLIRLNSFLGFSEEVLGNDFDTVVVGTNLPTSTPAWCATVRSPSRPRAQHLLTARDSQSLMKAPLRRSRSP